MTEFISSDPREVVVLAATDLRLFCRTFFPKTFRQGSPEFHQQIDAMLLDQNCRKLGIEVFRGGAKTTKLRAYTAHKISYATTRLVMFVSESQDHSIKSLRWIRRQIERNTAWCQTFQLSRGEKWTDEWIEIKHGVEGIVISVVAVGITGQTRGLNIDDFRPDLIVVDDPDNEETVATPEQREKTKKRFFGAIEKSLVPRSENPGAKLVLLQTSGHKDDLINTVHRSSDWVTRKFSIFDDMGNSRWEERFPTTELLADKQAHQDKNLLILWLREMECTPGDAETSIFRKEWLQYYDLAPETGRTIIAIDPVPPPSDRQQRMEFSDKDFEAFTVQRLYKGEYFLLEYRLNRGHEPEWTIAQFFELLDKYRPFKVRIEAVAYQRVLKWILERAMKERGRYVQIEAVDDKRNKRYRIQQAFAGVASNKRFYIRRDHYEFLEQFEAFPNVSHDDLLDSAASGLDELIKLAESDEGEETFTDDEVSEYRRKRTFRSAP